MNSPLFTVFTPTYNRAHTLGRVYQSLLSQTLSDFEWIIVDDGSTDETAALVNGFVEEGKIFIRYFYQPNRGKHVAFNRGVREARGEFFLPLDSDDACVNNALDRFNSNWLSIPKNLRANFSGITCLCKNECGEVVGSALPEHFLYGHPYEITSRYHLTGEKWGFHLTKILKDFPFPIFKGERFVPEGLIWNRIGKVYKIRFVNEALRLYHDSVDGLSASSLKIRTSNPRATCLYYSEAMCLPIRLIDRMKAASNFWRFSLQNMQCWHELIINQSYLMLITRFLPGIGLAFLDRVAKRG